MAYCSSKPNRRKLRGGRRGGSRSAYALSFATRLVRYYDASALVVLTSLARDGRHIHTHTPSARFVFMLCNDDVTSSGKWNNGAFYDSLSCFAISPCMFCSSILVSLWCSFSWVRVFHINGRFFFTRTRVAVFQSCYCVNLSWCPRFPSAQTICSFSMCFPPHGDDKRCRKDVEKTPRICSLLCGQPVFFCTWVRMRACKVFYIWHLYIEWFIGTDAAEIRVVQVVSKKKELERLTGWSNLDCPSLSTPSVCFSFYLIFSFLFVFM